MQENCGRKPQPNEEELNEQIFTDVIIATGDVNSHWSNFKRFQLGYASL